MQDKTKGGARTFGVDAFVRFPTLRPEVRQVSGPVPVKRDTTLRAVWLLFNYTGGVKESRWKKEAEVSCAWRYGTSGLAARFCGDAPTSQERDVGHPALARPAIAAQRVDSSNHHRRPAHSICEMSSGNPLCLFALSLPSCAFFTIAVTSRPASLNICSVMWPCFNSPALNRRCSGGVS